MNHFAVTVSTKPFVVRDMGGEFVCNKTFNKTDFRAESLPCGEYENCVFANCNFSQTNLSGVRFTDCCFSGCDMSLATLEGTIFHNATFKECKMLGLKFDSCDSFGFLVRFEGCILDNSSFFKRKLPKTVFDRCRLRDVDFAGCAMQESRFLECDLRMAQFADTDLRKADLRTSFNYTIDPTRNRIKKARFSLVGAMGLLESFDVDIEGV